MSHVAQVLAHLRRVTTRAAGTQGFACRPGRKMEHPRVGVLQTVVIASAGLLLAAPIPLSSDALTDPVTIAIGVVSLAVLLTTTIDTLWIILAAAVISLSASSVGVLASLH